MVLLKILFKDEASIIHTRNCIRVIRKLKSLRKIVKFVDSFEILDMYCFLTRVSDLNTIASGRVKRAVPFNDLPLDLQKSLIDIVDNATKKGVFIEYTWRNPPLNTTYIKRAFVKRILINREEYVIGAGYPLDVFFESLIIY